MKSNKSIMNNTLRDMENNILEINKLIESFKMKYSNHSIKLKTINMDEIIHHRLINCKFSSLDFKSGLKKIIKKFNTGEIYNIKIIDSEYKLFEDYRLRYENNKLDNIFKCSLISYYDFNFYFNDEFGYELIIIEEKDLSNVIEFFKEFEKID